MDHFPKGFNDFALPMLIPQYSCLMQFLGQKAYSQFRKECLLLSWRSEWEIIPAVAMYKTLIRSCESALLYMMGEGGSFLNLVFRFL